ncbi:23S rRNA (guanosine(2251)-2'-O)-methyltransferase RlmB [bacterium K02(2017)]|nr:23S rRNA (guanosine(2251)-2'-O)-methyltransferase RlmB [bacterium K02(2017)]
MYGNNPINEAIKAKSRHIKSLLLSDRQNSDNTKKWTQLCKQENIPLKTVRPEELDRLCDGAPHQGVIAYIDGYPGYDLSIIKTKEDKKHLVLALDCVQDPQNFGTLCRSALAFGVKYIILPKDRSVSVTASVCKASAGAVEHLKVIFVTNLSQALIKLKDDGFWVYGASLEGTTQKLTKIDPANKAVVVLGNEYKGIRPLVAKNCDQLVKIGMAGDFDSLNVAQAGTVILYDFYSKIFNVD